MKKLFENWNKYLNKSLITERDAKTKLQEYSLKLHKSLPIYKLIENKGPRHKPLIKVSVKIKPGMIISNEPGYYEENKFGIRIENLVYAKKVGKNFYFENLTLAPIEKDLINFDQLTQKEKNYLFKYHMEVYSKISPYLNNREKRWLASQI